jgi:hypothetical protein
MESTTRTETLEETFPELSAEPTTTRDASAATVSSSLVAAAGDSCVECNAKLAADQRYCVECGTRRGEHRIPFMDAMLRPAPQAEAAPPKKHKRVRMTANGSFIAGVGTLLLAMGIGVLIGRSGHDSGSSKNAQQVITVQGGGGTGSTAAAAAGTGVAAGATKAASSKDTKSKARAKAQAKKNAADLNRSTQKPGEKTPPPAVKIGSPGHGPGYKNGKFTGDFFGG